MATSKTLSAIATARKFVGTEWEVRKAREKSARLDAIRAEIKALQAEEETLKHEIDEITGGGSTNFGTWAIVYNTTTREYLKTKDLKADLPEVFEKYAYTTDATTRKVVDLH